MFAFRRSRLTPAARYERISRLDAIGDIGAFAAVACARVTGAPPPPPPLRHRRSHHHRHRRHQSPPPWVEAGRRRRWSRRSERLRGRPVAEVRSVGRMPRSDTPVIGPVVEERVALSIRVSGQVSFTVKVAAIDVNDELFADLDDVFDIGGDAASVARPHLELGRKVGDRRPVRRRRRHWRRQDDVGQHMEALGRRVGTGIRAILGPRAPPIGARREFVRQAGTA